MKQKFFLLSLLLLLSFQADERKYLLVIHADDSSIQENSLTLTSVSHMVAAYSADHGRETKALHLDKVIKEWNELFQRGNPNAALTSRSHNQKIRETVMVLSNPEMTGDTLSFQVQILGEAIEGDLGEAILFVDAAMGRFAENNS